MYKGSTQGPGFRIGSLYHLLLGSHGVSRSFLYSISLFPQNRHVGGINIQEMREGSRKGRGKHALGTNLQAMKLRCRWEDRRNIRECLRIKPTLRTLNQLMASFGAKGDTTFCRKDGVLISQTCSMHGEESRSAAGAWEGGGTDGCLPTPQLDASLFCRQSWATHITVSTQVLATLVFC